MAWVNYSTSWRCAAGEKMLCAWKGYKYCPRHCTLSVMSHVLIVDDEEHIVELVKLFLSREGFETREAFDGPSALELFHAESPDLVILDLMLPGLPGTEVCKEIRKVSDVPILMLTAKDDIVDKVVG